MLTPVASLAEDAVPVTPELKLDLDNSRIVNPRPDRLVPFFTKKGTQRGCDYVVYSLSFGLRGDPQGFADPSLAARLNKLKLDFKDQLPHGLEIVNVNVAGDGTDLSGGPLPGASISTSANPNDTATVSDFRLSAADLDGAGAPNERVITFRDHRQDRPRGVSFADDRRQPGCRSDQCGRHGVIIPSQDRASPTTATSRPA